MLVKYASIFSVFSLLSFLVYNLLLLFLAGLREWFSQTDERGAPPRIPAMANIASAPALSKKNVMLQESSVHPTPPSFNQINAASQNSVRRDGYSDQIAEEEQEVRFMPVP